MNKLPVSERGPMTVKLFEKLHQEAIEWETEYLISTGEYKEEEYDQVWEQAIENVSAEMKINLL
jgi:hypothetical protein